MRFLLQLILCSICICSSLSIMAASNDADTLIETGRERFVADCGFCHGRDAQGGSRGLDLTRSELVAEDIEGNLIGAVIKTGREDKGMPAFATLNNTDLSAIAAYIHNQQSLAESANGGRRSVEPEDLAVGNADLGQQYFARHCTTCHSGSGDLAGIASRQIGLELLRNMLYPRNASRSSATLRVIDESKESYTGTLAYRDEFVVAMRDSDGVYRSWSTNLISYSVEDPLDAHVAQLALYSDADIHNVYAYLLTLEASEVQP